MIVETTVNRAEKVSVHVKDIMSTLLYKWMVSIELAPGYYDMCYINSGGSWEGWQDTHGSGITTRIREASEEEKEIYQSFKIMSHLSTNLEK